MANISAEIGRMDDSRQYADRVLQLAPENEFALELHQRFETASPAG
jgi:hypothetical protein